MSAARSIFARLSRTRAVPPLSAPANLRGLSPPDEDPPSRMGAALRKGRAHPIFLIRDGVERKRTHPRPNVGPRLLTHFKALSLGPGELRARTTVKEVEVRCIKDVSAWLLTISETCKRQIVTGQVSFKFNSVSPQAGIWLLRQPTLPKN